MDNNGQLTFSDDPLLNASNNVFKLIEDGEFKKAVDMLDRLMGINPDYPGLIECYRTSKFWLNRKTELSSLDEGKETADFLMKQWEIFDSYAKSKNMKKSAAYKSVMRYIFFRASENYKKAFKKQEDTTNNFDLLLNLGDCFLRLEEYNDTIETLEYARSSYKSNARLLSILAEAYFHIKDYPKSLLLFREAFFINPSDIDIDILKAKPIRELIEVIKEERDYFLDIREWIPVYGFIKDIFYVRRNLSKHQVESIKKEIFNLEKNFQRMDNDRKTNSNIIPRLINKYLWMLDYYNLQNRNRDNVEDIKKRLKEIDKTLFDHFFKNDFR